jgi:hypothetical protein
MEAQMPINRNHEHDDDTALDQLRITNLQNMLDHVRAYPADNADCVFELKLPLSMLTALMLRSEQTQDSPQSLILDALADAGY